MRKVILKSLAVIFFVIFFAFPAAAVDIYASVAASLTEVVTELENNFSAKNAGITFRNNFGASGFLAKQVENGAPADLFFSANTEWMDYLKEKKIIGEKNTTLFAYNVLVFVGKPALKVSGLKDLTKLSKIAIGSPNSVPAGQYAVEALKKAGMYSQLEGKMIMAKDVRACLTYADSGEVDGAFVYKTDALEMARNVKILFTVPQDLYPRVTYPVGLTAGGVGKPEAAACL